MNKKLLILVIIAVISIGGAALYYFYSNKDQQTPIRGTFIKNEKINYNISIGDAYEYYLYKSS